MAVQEVPTETPGGSRDRRALLLDDEAHAIGRPAAGPSDDPSPICFRLVGASQSPLKI